MEESKIFKNIWRFNALVIMLVGIFGLVLAIFSSIMLYKNFTRDITVKNIVNIEDKTKKKEEWKLGSITTIKGSNYIMMPLSANQNYSMDSYSKLTSSIKNYLFLDEEGNKKDWLFPNNDYLITQTNLLPNTSYGEQVSDIKAILYYVVKSDTNKDKLLTSSDFQTIAISKPDGTKYTELLGEIDFVNGYKVNGDTSLLVIYQRKNIAYSAKINLSTFVVSDESKLPSVNQ
jgi:hypothetical protein